MKIGEVICQGFTDGPLTLPTFAVQRGQEIALQLPDPSNETLESRLCDLLLHPRPEGPIQGPSAVAWVGAFCPPTAARWKPVFQRWLLPSPRFLAWLKKTAKMPSKEATAVLARMELSARWRMNQLAGTPKALLRLEAALCSGAQVVVVSMAGLDPLGREAVLNAVRDKLHQFAAIYLSGHYFSQGSIFQDQPSGMPSYAVTWAAIDALTKSGPCKSTKQAS